MSTIQSQTLSMDVAVSLAKLQGLVTVYRWRPVNGQAWEQREHIRHTHVVRLLRDLRTGERLCRVNQLLKSEQLRHGAMDGGAALAEAPEGRKPVFMLIQ